MAKTIEIGPYSAYAIAVTNGYDGTEEEWLASLVGPRGMQGASITGVKIDGNEHIIVTIHDPATNTDTTIDAGPIDNTSAVQSIQQAAQEALQQVAASTEAAQTAATQAAESASNAATSAQTAAEQANAAGESAGQAANSASSAGNSATAAAGSASAAKASETNAANSASTAQASEDKVHADATAATEAAEKAAASEQAAATSESNAAESAEQAQASETAAAGSATQAAASQAAASESADKAQQAASDAQSAAGEIDAGIIVESASGEVISVSDSANAKLRGLRIYGKSVQDGVPTPENPIEIESAGNGGDITTLLRGNNLLSNDFVPKILNYTADSLTKTDYGVTFDVISTAETIGGVWLDHVLSNMPKGITVSLDITVSSLDFSSFRFGSNTDYKNVMSSEFSPNQVKHITHTIASDSYGSLTFYFNKVSGNPSFSVNISNIMISAGTKDYPFEPYTGQTLTYPTPNGLPGIPVESGGNYTDEDGQQWYCDIVDLSSGVYLQNVEYINAKEKEWTVNVSWSNSNGNCILAYYVTDAPYVSRALSNRLKTVTYSSIPEYYKEYEITVENQINTNKSAIYISIPLTVVGEATNEAFASYLESADIYILMPKAMTTQKIDISLTSDPLTTYNPNTTITTDSDPAAGVSVDYVADTKTYIDNKIAAISEVILGGTKNGNV